MKKNILLAVVGLNPCLLLSALSSFIIDKKTKIDKIFCLTTTQGRDAIESFLFKEKNFYKFKKKYSLKNIEFDISNVIVPADKDGNFISGIFSKEEIHSFFNECFSLLKNLSNEDNTTIHYLLTGGVKSMGIALLSAAQFFSKDEDRLYVLSLLNEKGFSDEISQDEQKKYILEEIPCVFFRDQANMQSLLGLSIEDFLSSSDLVNNLKILINLSCKEIIINDIVCKIPPALFAFYMFFVKKKLGCTHKKCKECKECYMNISEIFKTLNSDLSEIYKQITSSKYNLSKSGIQNLSTENFNSYKSKIKRIFLKSFGVKISNQICIESLEGEQGKEYGIKVEKNSFVIKEKEIFSCCKK